MPAKDTCFIADTAGPGERDYFNKRRGGFLRPKDEIKGIERRYAVLGSFAVSWKEETTTGFFSKVKKSRNRTNVFYVNLTDAKLYCVRRNLLAKKSAVDEFDFVEKIMDLPPKALEFLSDIVKGNSITYRELNKKHFLFLDGNPDMMMILRTRELIDVEPKFSGTEYAAKMNMPSFDSRSYDLRSRLSSEEKTLSEQEKDAVKHAPEDVLWRLEKLLQGKGEFSGFAYLPYDRCTYVDKEGRFRYDKLISLKVSTQF
jgi:hypothetical protein